MALPWGAASNRSPELATATAEFELDPYVRVLQIRVNAMRRVWHMSTSMRHVVESILTIVQSKGHPGCQWQQGICEAHDTEGWVQEQQQTGPVTLLLHACAQYGVRIDDQWMMHVQGHEAFSMLHAPVQYVKPYLIGVTREFRVEAGAKKAWDTKQGSGFEARSFGKPWPRLARMLAICGCWP